LPSFAQIDEDIAGYNMYIDKLDNPRAFPDQSFVWGDTSLVFLWEDSDSTDDQTGFTSQYLSSPVANTPIYFVNDSSLWGADTFATAGVDLFLIKGVYEFTVTALDVAGNESGRSEPVYIRMIRRARVPINLKFITE
jgi:hypothetical protein